MASLNFLVVTLVVVLLTDSVLSITTDLKCKDDSGNSVDWFFGYKLPRDPSSQDQGLREGSAYYVIKPGAVAWQRSSKLIDQPDSILATTLADMYTNRSDLAYIIWNDQPPGHIPKLWNGHTKGLVVATKKEGILLQHSIPHFPLVTNNGIPVGQYSYPSSGHQNGQMFLCLSLSLTQLDSIGEALKYTKPDIYDSLIPDEIVPLLPTLSQVVKKNATKKSGPWFTTLSLRAGILDFTVFVKGPKFRKEIYGDWIAPKLSISLDVQSWLNGRHPIHSNCNLTYGARNIITKEIEKITFATGNDHSKWAVATSNVNPWICVGDLNRMKPQKTRGGLALCVTNTELWNTFKSSVVELQPCNSVKVSKRKSG